MTTIEELIINDAVTIGMTSLGVNKGNYYPVLILQECESLTEHQMCDLIEKVVGTYIARSEINDAFSNQFLDQLEGDLDLILNYIRENE